MGAKPGSAGSGVRFPFPKNYFVWGILKTDSRPYKPTSALHPVSLPRPYGRRAPASRLRPLRRPRNSRPRPCRTGGSPATDPSRAGLPGSRPRPARDEKLSNAAGGREPPTTSPAAASPFECSSSRLRSTSRRRDFVQWLGPSYPEARPRSKRFRKTPNRTAFALQMLGEPSRMQLLPSAWAWRLVRYWRVVGRGYPETGPPPKWERRYPEARAKSKPMRKIPSRISFGSQTQGESNG